jgi:hypothetical protein
MHQVLQIQEIYRNIVSHVYADPTGPQTLFALARTSRGLSELAIDALWQEQRSIGPLIKTLPEDLWLEDTKSRSLPMIVRALLLFSISLPELNIT